MFTITPQRERFVDFIPLPSDMTFLLYRPRGESTTLLNEASVLLKVFRLELWAAYLFHRQ